MTVEWQHNFFNSCCRQGVQGANPDFLMGAVVSRQNPSIFTTDKDFKNFRRFLPIALLK